MVVVDVVDSRVRYANYFAYSFFLSSFAPLPPPLSLLCRVFFSPSLFLSLFVSLLYECVHECAMTPMNRWPCTYCSTNSSTDEKREEERVQYAQLLLLFYRPILLLLLFFPLLHLSPSLSFCMCTYMFNVRWRRHRKEKDELLAHMQTSKRIFYINVIVKKKKLQFASNATRERAREGCNFLFSLCIYMYIYAQLYDDYFCYFAFCYYLLLNVPTCYIFSLFFSLERVCVTKEATSLIWLELIWIDRDCHWCMIFAFMNGFF